MGNRLLNESFIKQRSEELQMTYENLLAASVLEEIVKRIGESVYADIFWLKNSSGLSLENYRKKVDLTLSYYIDGTEKFPYEKDEIRKAFAEIFRNLKQESMQWIFQIWDENKMISVSLTAIISNIEIPVKIRLESPTAGKMVPGEKDIRLFSNNNQKIRVKCFPIEYLIVEKFLDILEKLELMNDLSGYMNIYEILKKEPVSGRKVWELLSKGCRERGIRMDEKRFELLISYRTNHFMIKKWKAYLRREKRKKPSWDEVIGVIDEFFSNIWMSMCRNVIYLGDWMPELGRFID